MSVLKIGVVSVASVGGVTGAVVLARNIGFRTTEKIKRVSDKLKEEKFVLISSESEWQSMLSKYNAKKDEVGSRFVSGNSVSTLEELKLSCKSALGEDSSTSQNYSKSRRWCTVVKTLKDHLSAHSFVLLNVNSDSETDRASWEKLQRNYEAKGQNSISGLTFSEPDKWKKLKEECKNISEKETVEADFDTLFGNLKSWCTRGEADKLS